MERTWWSDKSVVLLGGASLIGTHLGDALMKKGVRKLRIVDNLSSGKWKNIWHLEDNGVRFYQWDLRDYNHAIKAVEGFDVVFHLASQHGGRGYVAGHATNLWNNLELDTTIYRACALARVGKVIFSSSACIYPVYYQEDVNVSIRLSEDYAEPSDLGYADGPYGTEKYVSEMMLDAHVEAGDFKGVSTRSYTVYGPLMGETHAIAAFIARTMIKQEPFEIWGSPRGIIRNWTYVEDNVAGALLAAEHMDRGAVNIGVEDRLFPEDALEIIWNYIGWRPNEVVYKGDKPTGPVNRVSDSTLLKSFGWKPKHTFEKGLHKTIDWYYSTHTEEDVRENFERRLTEI